MLASNPANRILYSDDCLNVLNDELALPTGSVDLIYLDPPFNSKSIYNLPFAGGHPEARPVQAFVDTWIWGTEEDDLLRDLHAGPQTRYLADIVSLAQRIDLVGGLRGGKATARTASPLIWSTWPRGCWQCGGCLRRRAVSISTATIPPAITSKC